MEPSSEPTGLVEKVLKYSQPIGKKKTRAKTLTHHWDKCRWYNGITEEMRLKRNHSFHQGAWLPSLRVSKEHPLASVREMWSWFWFISQELEEAGQATQLLSPCFPACEMGNISSISWSLYVDESRYFCEKSRKGIQVSLSKHPRPQHTYTHTHTHTYICNIYVYIFPCYLNMNSMVMYF